MRKITIAFIILAVLALSTAAPAQIRSGAVSVSPYVGGFWFDGNQSLNHNVDYGLRLGYDFTRNLGAEAVFNYVNTKYEPTGTSTSANVYNYRLEGLYHFMPDKRFVPFIALGGGAQTINYNDNTTGKTMGVADYGIGFKYFFTDWLALRADVRHVLAFDSVHNDLEYGLGLPFYFGGKKVAPMAMREEPAAPALQPEVKKTELPPPPPPPPPPVVVVPTPTPVEEMKKEPEAAATVEQRIVEKGRTTLNVEFDTGKAVVKNKYYKEIQNVADVMVKYPDLNIAVEGHTDNVGGKQYNLNLSQKRAEAIKKIMVTKFKIDPARVTAKGFGFSRPIASNANKEGRQKNRRVEAAVEYTYTK